MKDLYYNIDDAEFIDQSGEKLSRFVPELFYQENAVWRIFLRDRDNHPRDLTGIVAWSAAVDRDYDSATAPMCRVTPENISADPATGAVTVTLDAATAEFLAAVNGVPKRRAFFELHGLSGTGDRMLYLGFEIRARMILDPAPGAPQQIPEIFATRIYADMTARQVASAVLSSGGYVTSGGAAVIASSAASGAIFSGAEIHTTVGSYTVEYTSSGGLLISGGGAQFQVSGGAVTASGASGESMVLSGGVLKLQADDQSLTVDGEGGITIAAENPGHDVNISAGAGNINLNVDSENGTVTVNSRPVLTALDTATDSETTSASFDVLSGGTSYVYTQPISAFDITSIASGCPAAMEFTAGANFTPSFPASAVKFGQSACDSGKHYVVVVNGSWVVVNEGRI